MKNIVIWGTGKVSKRFVETAIKDKDINIIGFIDNEPNNQGTTFFEKEVFGPEKLCELSFDEIVICTIYFDEIKNQIFSDFPFAVDKIRNGQYSVYLKGLISRYKNSSDEDIKEILNYLEKRDLQIFNYDFTDKYREMKVETYYDENHKMYYIKSDDKKMYFAGYLDSPEKVIKYYKSICEEQDSKSPHRYLTEGFDINEDDVVVDVGVAEGNFTLSIIDKIKKAYLIETDERWIEALRLTFKDYQDKVVFINKFITSYSFEQYEILDNLIFEPVNFIKMDIEGSECEALDGMKNLVEISPELKVVICAYHNDYDETIIKMKLSAMNFEYKASSGYMWYPYNKSIPTKLCRGLVRGVKKH